MKNNKWKEIWEKRSADSSILKSNNARDIFLELKRCDGYDVIDGALTYEAMYSHYQKTNSFLFKDYQGEKSVFEVGCGSGANLFLYENDNIKCGGIDYSNAQINIAKQVLNTTDLDCLEAINLDTSKKYASLLSNAVFSYFSDTEYAEKVLEKMLDKSLYSIAVLDIHDEEKEQAFTEYRRKSIEDYDEKYKDYHKLFYSKDFFRQFAKKNNLEIIFAPCNIENYWNNDFAFDCYFYKK